jgi:hypothetical protein
MCFGFNPLSKAEQLHGVQTSVNIFSPFQPPQSAPYQADTDRDQCPSGLEIIHDSAQDVDATLAALPYSTDEKAITEDNQLLLQPVS